MPAKINESEKGNVNMTVRRFFYLSMACLAILSFWAPVQLIGLTLSAGEYFLVGGTLSILTEYIPYVLESAFALLQDPLNAIFWGILSCVFTMAEILHNYAIAGLVAWSFLMLVTTFTPISRTWRKFYHIWLVLSLASSLLMSLNPLFQVGSGFGYWLNPILLIFATLGEIYFAKIET